MTTTQAPATTIDKIVTAYDKASTAKGKDKFVFVPEIKVKRDNDILYVSDIRKTKMNTLMVTVEVYTITKSDKAPMPIQLLSELAQKEILSRLLK